MDNIIDFIKMNLGWIITIAGFFIPPVRDFVIKQFQSSLDKALEDKKSVNERKNYISKTRFDTEFEIYRQLSKDSFATVKLISRLIPYGLVSVPVFNTEGEKDEYDKKIYKEASDAFLIMQDNLQINAPFIKEELYDGYNEILALCNCQLHVFQQRWNLSFVGVCKDDKLPTTEDYERTKEMQDKFDDLNKKVREYLASLDVL